MNMAVNTNQAFATANDKAASIDKMPSGQVLKSAKDAATGLNADFTTFMKMLTTQLKYQDPTNAMEAHEFTQQIVAFTGVEQAVATNSNLEKLIELNKGVQFSHASGLIGKEVEYDSSQNELRGGFIAPFSYSLEPNEGQDIRGTKIQIINSQGMIVNTLDGATMAGPHRVQWNGLNILHKPAPDDTYHIIVNSVDDQGRPINVGSYGKTGIVREAEIVGGKVMVNVNGVKIPVSQIKTLRASNDSTNISDKALNQIIEKLAAGNEQPLASN